MSPEEPNAPTSADEIVSESDALHQRVRAFARASLGGGESDDGFEDLALQLAQFQARRIPGYAQLVESRGALLERFESIVAVPTDVFRLTRVAVHDASDDVAAFHTSGTTAALSGKHFFRTLKTYEELSLSYGKRALTSAFGGGRVVVALAPPPSQAPHSSLGHMLSLFMNRWDGRAVSVAPRGAVYDPESGARWLGGSGGVDLEGLRRAALVALERQEPLLLLATSFALVAMLDGLAGALVPAPKRTVVMYTGGFKGRSREVKPGELRREVARVFRIPEEHVTGEYGMTELTSQLYEGTLPGSELAAPKGVYLEPPWLRVVPVNPVSLKPVRPGEVGLAKIIDLGNVDSAVAILTQDLVRRVPVGEDGSGIQLLGRRKGSPVRGCSLSFESWIVGARQGAA